MTQRLIKMGVIALAFALAIVAPNNRLTDSLNQGIGAQTTITQTTLAAAVTASAVPQRVSLTSGTGAAAGSFIFVDRELMLITNATTTTLPSVQRGQAGTKAAAHASGAVAYVGVPNAFYTADVAGVCTSANELYLPHVNPQTGNVFQCYNSVWQRILTGGVPAVVAPNMVTTTAVDGAITIVSGTVRLTKGSAAAMTLAAPTAAQEGTTIVITAGSAFAHVVTATGLIQDGVTGGAKNSWTSAAFVGSSITLQAVNLQWYVVSKNLGTVA